MKDNKTRGIVLGIIGVALIGCIVYFLNEFNIINLGGKDKNDNPSIGLILCKNKDKFIAQYSLKDVNKPIGISSFKLKEYLPSEEDLNMYIDLENE